MTMIPTSTGIGAPGTAPAPANLGRSPMSSQPAAAAAIPFTRGSTLATMADQKLTLAAGSTTQIQLQTNAFLESLVLDFTMTTSGNSATVAFANDGPFNVIQQIKLDDPAGQSIVAPITGFQLFTLNKYLPDTDCDFDPCRDPNYSATTGSGGTGGSFSFRLVVPVEYRRRDALGALNNSAANQRYLLTISTIASYVGTTGIYSTAPTTAGTLTLNVYQQYWTSPPSAIVTSAGSAPVQATPSGLGTVAFVRYERHNEVSGGGSPQIQLNNVGDYISEIIWTLRDSSNVRDSADWPTEFDFWVNDFQVRADSANDWQRWISRFYGYYGAATAKPTAGSLDNGVYVSFYWSALFDASSNFGPANQLLPTDATTKLQVRGSTWGSSASYLEVLTRMIRPVSGAALFA